MLHPEVTSSYNMLHNEVTSSFSMLHNKVTSSVSRTTAELHKDPSHPEDYKEDYRVTNWGLVKFLHVSP